MPMKCMVYNCSKASVAKGLCDTHRKRVERHGDVDAERAPDWGKREKHPAYRAWTGLRRHHRFAMPEEWFADFWAFVRDVPEKVNPVDRAHRPDPQAPWGPANFFWKTSEMKGAEQRAAYMREWQRRKRAVNANYHKDADLRRTYGVTLDWYKNQHKAQEGVCAICGCEETARIHGRLLSLAVDHCHDTGRVRGLLCRACNNAIGALKHDRELLQAAIAYLEE